MPRPPRVIVRRAARILPLRNRRNPLSRSQFNSDAALRLLRSSEDCVICQSPQGVSTSICTPCIHCFHPECLLNWYNMQENLGRVPDCPICRATIGSMPFPLPLVNEALFQRFVDPLHPITLSDEDLRYLDSVENP